MGTLTNAAWVLWFILVQVPNVDWQASDCGEDELFDRALSAYEAEDYDSALADFRQLAEEFPESESRGAYHFNIAVALQQQGRWQEAITAFGEVIDMGLNDRDPEGQTVMQMGFRNYRFRSAVRIMVCFEELGDYEQALKWNRLASSTYSYQHWCGTCSEGTARQLEYAEGRIARQIGWGAYVPYLLRISGKVVGPWVLLVLWLGWGACLLSWARANRLSVIFLTLPVSWILFVFIMAPVNHGGLAWLPDFMKCGVWRFLVTCLGAGLLAAMALVIRRIRSGGSLSAIRKLAIEISVLVFCVVWFATGYAQVDWTDVRMPHLATWSLSLGVVPMAALATSLLLWWCLKPEVRA